MLLGIKPVKLIVAVEPAQTVAACETVLNAGAGFTVNTTFWPGELSHPLAVVVTIYVTVTGANVVLVNTSFTFPLPLFAGWLIPDTTDLVQVNVAPDTGLVGT